LTVSSLLLTRKEYNMASNQKQVTDALRADWTEKFMAYVYAHDTDVCQTAAGTFMFPVVDAAGEDRWIKVSVIIPKDANEADGTDGYSLAQEYKLKQEAARERARKREEEAAAKRAKAEKKEK
jgi:hypothetical protein